MALRLRDRVRQKTTTTGTGTLTLGSAVSAFSTFADRLSDGDLTYYTISNATQYEVGSGVYLTGTLSRDTVFSSSNSDQRINLSVESDVFITYPSDKSVHLSEDRVITGVQAIDWVLNGTPEYLEGRVFYDNINHALAVFNDEPDITLQVGQENYIRVRNNTGATITNGQAVKILGAQGTNTTVQLAIATDAIKSQAVGLATHDIEHNSFGYVTTFGSVNDLDTSDFNDGDEIFLSPVISGGLTGVSPTAPDYVVSLGHVIRSHPAVGNILVQPGFPKLGGGDVKSLGDKVASGVAFTAQIAGTDAAIIASTTGLIYDSGNSILRVDAGGIRFPDGNTQTIAYTGQVGADPTGVVSGVAFFNSNDNTISSYTGLVYNSGDNRFILKDIGARFEVRDNAGQRTLVLGDNSTAGTTNVGYISFHVNDEEIGDIRANANGLMVRTQQNTRDLLIRNSDNTIIAKFAGGSQDYELFLEPHDATKVGQIIQGAVSQTANLQEWQDSSQNVLASVDYKGTVSGSGYTFPDGVTQTIAYTGQEADLSSYATISYVDSVSGNLQAEIDTNAATSGYLQGQIDSNDTDISSLQTATGLLEVRVAQNELDITALETATGLLEPRVTQNETDITSLETATGNLDTRVTQNESDINSVSGLLYNNWNINVTGNVDSITSNETVLFTGIGNTSVTYDSSSNIVSISGADQDLSSYATTAYVNSVSGNLQGEIDSNDTDISALQTATGLLETRVTQNETDITTLETATGLLEVRVTQNETDITALETATGLLDTRVTQNTNDISSSSGYLQGQINTNDTDISNLQTATGLLETRVTQNELDITALENATGNLDTRVTQNTNDITSVSGLLYNNWNINVTGNVDSITSNENVVFTGVGLTSVSYDSSTNTVSISGSADGDTTYTAGSGLALDGDEFNVYGGTGLLDALYFPADGSGVGINITLSPSRFASQIPGNGSQPRILVGFGNDQYPIYEELDGTVVVGHFNNSGAIGRTDGNLVFGNGCLRLSSGCYENRIFGKSNMTSSSNSHSNVIVGFNSAFGLTDTSSAYIISSNQGANNASNIDSTVVIGQQNALNATDFTESVSIGGGASIEASGDKNLILGYAAGYQIAGDNNIDIHNNPSFLNIIGSNSNKLNIGSTIVGDTSSKLLAIGNVGASDITPDATLEIKPNASTDVGLIVQAAASHTANLQEWQDSSENVLAYVDPSGAISGADIFTEQLEVNLASSSDIGVTVQGVASQTANLQEWKNSVGSGAYIDNSGNFVFQSYNDTTRPAAGVAGRVIFNTDDGNLNIDNGTNWIHPSGGTT